MASVIASGMWQQYMGPREASCGARLSTAGAGVSCALRTGQKTVGKWKAGLPKLSVLCCQSTG